jgi:hypothetical protein
LATHSANKKLSRRLAFYVMKDILDLAAKVLRGPKHHFRTGLDFALLQFGDVGPTDTEPPGQVSLSDSLAVFSFLPPC